MRSQLSDFCEAMTPAVQRAAALAHSLEGKVRNTPKTGEADAVKQALTDADTAAQEVVLEALVARYPDVSVAAEEDTDTARRFPKDSSALVIVDPIDGTLRSYLEARGPYAVIVGLAVKRSMEAGIVALPREGLLFDGQVGQGARSIRPRGEVRPAAVRADGDRVLVSHSMPSRVLGALAAEGLEAVPACGGAIAVAPLIRGVRAGLRYVQTQRARGISTRGRVGALVSREAGAHLQGDGAQPFPTDLDTPTRTLRVVADEADLAVLDRCLAAADL